MRLTLIVGAALSAVAGCANIHSPANSAANIAHLRGCIAESGQYESLHPRFAKAFAFMRRADLADLPCGRYEIDCSNCWSMVKEDSLNPLADENK